MTIYYSVAMDDDRHQSRGWWSTPKQKMTFNTKSVGDDRHQSRRWRSIPKQKMTIDTKAEDDDRTPKQNDDDDRHQGRGWRPDTKAEDDDQTPKQKMTTDTKAEDDDWLQVEDDNRQRMTTRHQSKWWQSTAIHRMTITGWRSQDDDQLQSRRRWSTPKQRTTIDPKAEDDKTPVPNYIIRRNVCQVAIRQAYKPISLSAYV